MHAPRATYRLQFHEGFRLADALALVPYFHELGISHVYASPLFKASPHSQHGYDVCDFTRINDEIGSEADLAKLVAALHERQMGLVLDIVPNHMGISSSENHWWWDVLKHGKTSAHAGYFDIDWNSPAPKLHGKILVPILGDDYEKVLARGEFKLEKQNSEHILNYFEHRLPLAPNSVPKEIPIEQINQTPAALDQVIERQNYRLADFRQGDQCLNYRRFFAVNSLAGVRVEDTHVFDEVHSLLRRWIENGWIDGVRVDHPDGLRDPEKYLRCLRKLAPEKWIVVEKILEPQENLPGIWSVQGTTGYDFLNQANGVFIDGSKEKDFTDFYADFTGERTGFEQLIQEKKLLVLNTLFVTEINRLARSLPELAAQHPFCKNFGAEQWSQALIALAAAFPVYRTYVRGFDKFLNAEDDLVIQSAVAKAGKSRPDLKPELFNFLSGLLQLKLGGEAASEFVARFQQLTGPAMAKGVEDTVFYCYNRFVSLNEVGGNPGGFGIGVAAFHAFCEHQKSAWPHTLLASSTHDTKRSEDVRARLNVLSETPGAWFGAVRRWSAMNERHRTGSFPDRNAEYLFYQTVVGAWPISPERVAAYLEKAAREAKQHTHWEKPDKAYEDALRHFITEAMNDAEFKDELEKFVAPISTAAAVNSLSQTLLKLTAPGVPDIYQGCELENLYLVDPDNRQPVDFEFRQQLLSQAKNLSAGEAWSRRGEGLAKLWLIQKTLEFRAGHSTILEGSYAALAAGGEKSEHVIAFMRGSKAIVIAQRLSLILQNEWKDTSVKLPAGQWGNVFTGEIFNGPDVRLKPLLQAFPVALLVRKETAA